jgi:hypothetical protein
MKSQFQLAAQLKLDPNSNVARLPLFTAAAAQKERILLRALAVGAAPDLPGQRTKEPFRS